MTTNHKLAPRGEFPNLSFWVMALGMSVAPAGTEKPQAERKTDAPLLANNDPDRDAFSPDAFFKIAGE